LNFGFPLWLHRRRNLFRAPYNPIKLGAARNKLPAAAAFAPHTPNDYYDCCRIDSVSHNAAADFMRG
jgi:hypothetical protein